MTCSPQLLACVMSWLLINEHLIDWLIVGLPLTRAGRRTDIVKPGYPRTGVWRPSNTQIRGFIKSPRVCIAFLSHHSPGSLSFEAVFERQQQQPVISCTIFYVLSWFCWCVYVYYSYIVVPLHIECRVYDIVVSICRCFVWNWPRMIEFGKVRICMCYNVTCTSFPSLPFQSLELNIKG